MCVINISVIKKISFVFIPFAFGVIATISIYRVLVNRHDLSPVTTPLTSSVEKPPSAALVGTITAFSGTVLWLSRVANSPVAITQPQSIQQGEELQTKNGTITVSFTNTATIQLAKNAQLSIIQTLPVDIVFQQTQGTVTYTASGSLPVSIRGLDLLVTMKKGTETVSVDAKKQLVTVLVTDGSAIAAYTHNNKTQVVTVSQKEKFTFDNNEKNITD